MISLVVRIEYGVRNPAAGLDSVLPSEAYPYVSGRRTMKVLMLTLTAQRVPHVYTPSGCRSVLGALRRYSLHLVPAIRRSPVPRQSTGEGASSAGAEDGNYPVVVVASGKPAKQVGILLL